MAQTLTASAPVKSKVRLGPLLQQAAGYLILAGLVVWLLVNFFKSPSQFFSSALTGLQNGTLYALIALGYTLVYGIIELINFAHGDLFMLGTLASATVMTTVLHQDVPGFTGWLGLLLTLVVVMAFCATINVTIEFLAYRRLRRAPKLAP